jgi:hypothetical protein
MSMSVLHQNPITPVLCTFVLVARDVPSMFNTLQIDPNAQVD